MPMVTPAFCSIGTLRGSYSRERIFGSHFSARSACRRIAGTLAYVMVNGQPVPASAWLCR